jgi:hypothetical protein
VLRQPEEGGARKPPTRFPGANASGNTRTRGSG